MFRSPVVLVHSNRLFSEGLARICESGQFRITSALASWDRLTADSISEPAPVFIVGGNEAAATVRSIRGDHKLCLIVVVGESGDADEIAEALAAGASCYLRETSNSDLLLKTLDLLTQNEVILSRQHIRQDPRRGNGDDGSSRPAPNQAVKDASPSPVINGNGAAPHFTQNTDALPPGTKLSVQENVILQGLVEGSPNKVIANRLHITEATVKVHVKAILRKIPAKNRTQAAIWAVKQMVRVCDGLLSADTAAEFASSRLAGTEGGDEPVTLPPPAITVGARANTPR